MPEDDLPLLTFANAEALERWLDEQGEASPGAWLRFAKQGAPESTVSKSDAIDCALAWSTCARPRGRMRPASSSLSTRSRLICDQALLGRLGVKRVLKKWASTRPSWPSTQP